MVSFSYPAYDDVVQTIELPSPELFDTHNYTKDINIHISRDKTIRTYVFNDDVTKRVIDTNLDFKLTLSKLKELEDFLEAAKGEYLLYTDIEGSTWTALINQDTIDSSSTGGRGSCGYASEIYTVSLVLKKWKDGYGTVANPDENETNTE